MRFLQTISLIAILLGMSMAGPHQAHADAAFPTSIPPGNMLRGTGITSGTTATSIIPAQAAGIKIYVTAVQCFNPGSLDATMTLNDTETAGSGTQVFAPAHAGAMPNYSLIPLVVPAATALTFTPNVANSNAVCDAQGYSGP